MIIFFWLFFCVLPNIIYADDGTDDNKRSLLNCHDEDDNAKREEDCKDNEGDENNDDRDPNNDGDKELAAPCIIESQQFAFRDPRWGDLCPDGTTSNFAGTVNITSGRPDINGIINNITLHFDIPSTPPADCDGLSNEFLCKTSPVLCGNPLIYIQALNQTLPKFGTAWKISFIGDSTWDAKITQTLPNPTQCIAENPPIKDIIPNKSLVFSVANGKLQKNLQCDDTIKVMVTYYRWYPATAAPSITIPLTDSSRSVTFPYSTNFLRVSIPITAGEIGPIECNPGFPYAFRSSSRISGINAIDIQNYFCTTLTHRYITYTIPCCPNKLVNDNEDDGDKKDNEDNGDNEKDNDEDDLREKLQKAIEEKQRQIIGLSVGITVGLATGLVAAIIGVILFVKKFDMFNYSSLE